MFDPTGVALGGESNEASNGPGRDRPFETSGSARRYSYAARRARRLVSPINSRPSSPQHPTSKTTTARRTFVFRFEPPRTPNATRRSRNASRTIQAPRATRAPSSRRTRTARFSSRRWRARVASPDRRRRRTRRRRRRSFSWTFACRHRRASPRLRSPRGRGASKPAGSKLTPRTIADDKEWRRSRSRRCSAGATPRARRTSRRFANAPATNRRRRTSGSSARRSASDERATWRWIENTRTARGFLVAGVERRRSGAGTAIRVDPSARRPRVRRREARRRRRAPAVAEGRERRKRERRDRRASRADSRRTTNEVDERSPRAPRGAPPPRAGVVSASSRVARRGANARRVRRSGRGRRRRIRSHQTRARAMCACVVTAYATMVTHAPAPR